MKELVIAAALAAAASACGGGGERCGNGVREGDEQCDEDTQYCVECVVVLPPRTVVKWIFNGGAAEGFSQDACNDLDVDRVHVAMVGPTEIEGDAECSDYQVSFMDLPPGTYQAAVTPLDDGGDPLVVAPVTQEIIAETTDVEEEVVIPFDAWLNDYTGSFFFTIRWGGVDCADAWPEPVATTTITLSVDGQVVSQSTTAGQELDGAPPGACVPASNPSPMTALAIPFGPATIQIVGRTGTGVESFRGEFDTFVGAGPSNPTLSYDVDTVYDAGPPDAEPPPDAAPPDAMP